jgi:hypothetical protein
MKVLLVAPVEQGSGETVTCLHLAENLTAAGHEVFFLASAFAGRFLSARFADRLQLLGPDGPTNRRVWDGTIDEVRPDAVVFADYPLLHFVPGASPLASEPGWQDSLDTLDACLVTLDHFGFAQEEMGLFFGPPHLSFQYQRFPAIPPRMRILLPCPMHEPGPVRERRGDPFRYWDVPIEIPDDARHEARARVMQDGTDGYLILHSVPNWAWRQADLMGLPFYRHLGAIFDHYLRDLERPVTLVSVNNGYLLQTPVGAGIRIVNLEPLPTEEFERLLFAADLVLTENSVSIAMGKAICALQSCAALKNSLGLLEILERTDTTIKDLVMEMERSRMGTVFPFNVYPTGMVDELKRIVLYRDNSLTAAFKAVELFSGADARRQIHALLTDDRERRSLRTAQQEYVDRLRAIGTGADVLERMVEEARSTRS